MLEAVDLQAAYPHDWMHCKCCGWYGPDDGELGADHIINEDGSEPICPQCGNDGEAGEFDWTREVAAAYKETILPGLDWVICGGETGPGARPCTLIGCVACETSARARASRFSSNLGGSG